MKRLAITAALLASACSTTGPSAVPASPVLRPYATITASPTDELRPGSVVSAETPLPTPTPSSYTIKAGDTLSQIAEQLRVSVDVLLQANPGLDPNALRVGTTLNVPGGASGSALKTPTPVPVRILDIDCRRMATGAAWCFALVYNDSADTLENITGSLSILDTNGVSLANQDVALLMDILPPGASLPLAVSFPGPLPLDLRPQVRILTAMRVVTDTARYLPVVIQNTLTNVSWSGRTADISGDLILPSDVGNAAQVWIAALAYDESGRLVGWRRWESPGGMGAGTSMRFRTSVYSLAGPIQRVDLVPQASP